MAFPSSSIVFGDDALSLLQEIIQTSTKKNRKIFILVDSNTEIYCLPLFYKLLNNNGLHVETIVIPAGEANKTIETVVEIWVTLTKNGAGRDALLINLGGGLVTDIGGFAASCFKRGIETIHIPTTLLGMVDAAIGGKTGIDFDFYKNHIGTFYPPKHVLIFSDFLATLAKRELTSGFGEVLKYGYISNPELLEGEMAQFSVHSDWLKLIKICAASKEQITLDDPTEKGVRKILNFGHTIGHAFESYALENECDLLHGEAVACGMLSELWLSHQLFDLPIEIVNAYVDRLKKDFPIFKFDDSMIDELIIRMQHDKKNIGTDLRFVLIKTPGEAIFDVTISENLVRKSLVYYLQHIN